jgi:putative hydrolase of the HAD superfamily
LTAAPALLFDLDETLVVDEAALVASFRATAALGSEARSEIDAPRFAEAVRRLARELWHTAPEYPWAKAIGIASGEALWGRLEGEGPELAALREWAPGYRQAAWEAGLTSQGVDDPVLASALARRFADERRSRMC